LDAQIKGLLYENSKRIIDYEKPNLKNCFFVIHNDDGFSCEKVTTTAWISYPSTKWCERFKR